jgi:hypothetical protein
MKYGLACLRPDLDDGFGPVTLFLVLRLFFPVSVFVFYLVQNVSFVLTQIRRGCAAFSRSQFQRVLLLCMSAWQGVAL